MILTKVEMKEWYNNKNHFPNIKISTIFVLHWVETSHKHLTNRYSATIPLPSYESLRWEVVCCTTIKDLVLDGQHPHKSWAWWCLESQHWKDGDRKIFGACWVAGVTNLWVPGLGRDLVSEDKWLGKTPQIGMASILVHAHAWIYSDKTTKIWVNQEEGQILFLHS